MVLLCPNVSAFCSQDRHGTEWSGYVVRACCVRLRGVSGVCGSRRDFCRQQNLREVLQDGSA